MTTTANMTFGRYGHSYHLKIETVEALAHVVQLDEAHWIANNAPLNAIYCDNTFLQLLDADNNERITCREIKDAIRWLLSVLRDQKGITERSQVLHLGAIDTNTDLGRQIHAAACKALTSLGQPDANKITLDQVRQIKTQVSSTPISAAGVVLPEASEYPEIRQFIIDVIAAIGGLPHPAGAQGIGTAQLDKFIDNAAAYLNWHEQGDVPVGKEKTEIMPLGSDTASTYVTLTSLRAKLDQYFAQCEALAIDERFVQRMGWTEDELQSLDFDDPTVLEEVLKKAPLAKAKPGQPLNFEAQINPYYAETLAKFRSKVMAPVLGKATNTLSAEQWQKIKAFFAGHTNWLKSKPGAEVEPLGIDKLRKYLDTRFADAVRDLITDSTKTAFVLDNIQLIEKLILYQANIIDFANNFVSFPHLYDTNRRAMFETGSLVIDGRWFNLAVKVDNRQQHCEVAKTSNMFVLYVQITPKPGQPTFEVAVPVTSGGKGNLCLSKRGVFYDVAGNECDAKVVHIIENPISFKEALLSPFRRLGRLLTGKIESITTAAEKKLDAQASVAISQASPQPAASQPAAKQASGLAAGGLLMGGGVAIAALGSAAAYITKTLSQVSWLAIVIGITGALLLVMLPMAIVAFLKLRKRDLSVMLEGSGWGINAPMRLTHHQAQFFTQRPKYPKGSKGILRLSWRALTIILILLIAFATAAYLILHVKSDSPSQKPVPQVQNLPAPTTQN